MTARKIAHDLILINIEIPEGNNSSHLTDRELTSYTKIASPAISTSAILRLNPLRHVLGAFVGMVAEHIADKILLAFLQKCVLQFCKACKQ